MQSDYQIEDLVFQTREIVVYRAIHKNGIPHAIIRLKFSDEILENLQKQDRFQKGLNELQILQHSCLRPVVDGGLDSVDGIPWLAARWWEGTLLSESNLTQSEINLLHTQAQDLITFLGHRAGALCFKPLEIVITTASDGTTLHTFSIDYFSWFRDWAIGYPPGEKNDPHQDLDQLINSLTPAPQSPPKPTFPQTTLPQAPLSLPLPKTSPFKPLALIAILLLLISSGIWFINRKPGDPAPSDPIATDTPPAPESTNPKISTPPKTTSSTPKVETPKPAPKAKPIAQATSTPRPEFAGEIYDVDAGNLDDLKKNVGKWIALNGEVSAITGNSLSFEKSTVLATLPPDAPAIEVGQSLNITGFLKSTSILEIERSDDIIVNQPIKNVYTLDDEEQLRGMSRSIVSVQATVTDFTKTKTGSSLYLVFHEEGPGFRAGVSTKKAEEGLDEEFLRTFIGKEIIVTGEVSTFEKASGGKGNRLVIRFSKKSDIKVVGE